MQNLDYPVSNSILSVAFYYLFDEFLKYFLHYDQFRFVMGFLKSRHGLWALRTVLARKVSLSYCEPFKLPIS